MKFLSNLLIVASLIIYVFCPFFNLGLLGNLTGYHFAENMINDSGSILYSLVSLIPFFASFAAIYFNCLKGKYWSLISLLFNALYLGFFYWLYTSLINTLPIYNIHSFAWGYQVSLWIVIIATASTVISVLPFEKLFKKKKHEVVMD